MVKFRRYGKFSIKDIFILLASLILISFIGIVCILLKKHVVLSVIIIFIWVCWVIYTLRVYNELYSIRDRMICTFKLGSKEKIQIPERYTLIISYSDILSDVGKNHFFMKDKFSVSIIAKSDVDEILNELHKSKTMVRYTNSSIKNKFEKDFIYHFVFEKSVFEYLLSLNKCTVILPESLSHKMGCKLDGAVCLDVGF